MGREIKFRYWDMIRKEFITDCDVYFVAEDIIFAGDLSNPPLVDVTGHVLMSQYTGLKDKNGKEIYEGDVVSSKNKSGGCESNVDAVVFKDGRYVLHDKDNILLDMWIGDDDLEQIEVIGNIYENPELLEGE